MGRRKTSGARSAIRTDEVATIAEVTLMMRHGADGMPAPAEPMRGSAHILMMDDRESTERCFERLMEGGVITTPLGIQPWGDYYGKLTDRFGVQWMLNVAIRSRSS